MVTAGSGRCPPQTAAPPVEEPPGHGTIGDSPYGPWRAIYPARKLIRTRRTGLSTLVSTSTTLCQVPS
jgi:hypothetical protein